MRATLLDLLDVLLSGEQGHFDSALPPLMLPFDFEPATVLPKHEPILTCDCSQCERLWERS